MADKLLIEDAVGETRYALIRQGVTVEYHLRRWSDANVPRAGDMFSGRVRSVNKDLMAAFVDLGAEPFGLLRFTMSPNAPRLTEGQMIRVRVARQGEPGKGPLLQFTEMSDADKPAKESTTNFQDLIKKRYPDIKIEHGEVRGVEWAAEPEVKLKSGGFIYIEHTRAATAIDIDTGGGQKSKVCVEAAREIARQIRLRGIGGLILADFPNFRQKRARAEVWDALNRHLKHDPANVKVAPFSRFDTVELTRTRSGPTIANVVLDKHGEHSAETTALMGLRRLETEARVDGGARLVLQVQQAGYDWLQSGAIDWQSAMNDRIGARYRLQAGDSLDVFKDSK